MSQPSQPVAETPLVSNEVPNPTGWFGHPRGLATLFFTELWERFSYYGMRGILILFMTAAAAAGGLGFNDAKAGAIYGLYTSAVYLLALPGGWVADKLWGQRKAVFVGGCIIAAGHFSMALPYFGLSETWFFYLGLILIVIGTGLLKPNVSTMVGDLYPTDQARRDAGFSIFYMGINLGAFAGPLVCGYLGEEVNWHLGFSAAGFGMILGLIQYRLGGKYLGSAGELKLGEGETQAEVRQRTSKFYLVAGIAAAVIVGGSWLLLQSVGLSLTQYANGIGVAIALLSIAYFIYLLVAGGLTPSEKKKVVVIFWFFLLAAIFWSGFEQHGSSFNLFAERATDRVVGGWEVPASWFQSVNPIFIILLAPVFAWIWTALGRFNPPTPVKFGGGLVLLSIGFFVLAWGASYSSDGYFVSPAWLVVTFFLQTCGELMLSPVGLSATTKLAPKGRVGQMMGVWFIGASLGNLFAGLVAGRLEELPFVTLFLYVGGAIGILAVGALALSPVFKRLMGDVK